MVVVGVTPHQGGRESRLQDDGAQVTRYSARGGMRNAERRNRPEYPARTRKARFAAQESVSTAVQPAVLLTRLRAPVLQRWGDDARHDERDRGQDVAGEDRPHHRRHPSGTVSMDSSKTGLHTQEKWETSRPRPANVVGQTG